MGSCISMLPFTLKGPKFPARYTQKKIPSASRRLVLLLSGKQPVQTAQRGDLMGREIPKSFSSEMPTELSYWKKLCCLRSSGLWSPCLGKLVSPPAESCPAGTPMSSLLAKLDPRCVETSQKVRDGLKTIGCEEWETSPRAEQLSSSPCCCREEGERPAEKIHSSFFLNGKGKKKKKRILDSTSRAWTGTHS